MLLLFYSAVIVLLDLISLLVKILFSGVRALYYLFASPKEKSLAGENILITGAGHGIGRELALQLAEKGARLALWDVDAEKCKQTALDVKNKGGRAINYFCDVSERSQVLDTAAKVKRDLGMVGMVINNAGIIPIHPLLAHNPQQIRRVFDVNVLSNFWVLEAFLPAMIASNHGHIVAVCSMAGLVGSANLVPYGASKFALRGLMQSLAEELREDARKPKVHLTTIHPFIVDTGQVQRPRLRFPNLLGVQQPAYAAKQIIKAIQQNQREASVPGWLLPIHNIARALPVETFSLLKDFLDSGAEAHDPAWRDSTNCSIVSAANSNLAEFKTRKLTNGSGSNLGHRHMDFVSELAK